MPKISVIVPIYNEERYLVQCLNSIIEQSISDIEIICVNDGSTDSSLEIMKSFAEKDSRVKIVDKPNAGYGNSMNLGLAAATGDYIGIVESDDFITRRMYETLYNLTDNGTVDVVKGNFWDCYEENDGSITRIVNRERAEMPDVEEAFTVREHPHILWGHPSIWTGLYKRSFLEEHNIKFKEVKGGGWVDNPFFFDTLCNAKSIKWTKTPLYCYRKGSVGNSSSNYDLRLPFERMMDNLEVLNKNGFHDEEILKFAYARALMYLVGATHEKNFELHGDEVYGHMRKMLKMLNPDVIRDDFNIWDNKTFLKYKSPLKSMLPKTGKILIYNWVPFDNPNNVGGGVNLYCRNLIKALSEYRPDLDIYFISSGWAYDISKSDCFVRKIDNIFGDRCKAFEIVNSPVPAPQDMLFGNPSIAFENERLKNVFKKFIEENGPFDAIHFNNIEGLSFDVLDLKKDFKDTKFVFSFHNYVPLCMTGFYYMRHLHKNCHPGCNATDCDKCIDRSEMRDYANEMVMRGQFAVSNPQDYDGESWKLEFDFDKLSEKKDASYFTDFVNKCKDKINENIDVVLAVSQRVADIAIENGIAKDKVVTDYIGTKIANYQIGKSTTFNDETFRLVFLGSNLAYEEKGYPFLIKALSKLPSKYAEKTELILTTTTRDKDEELREKLSEFKAVNIIHGYKHSEIARIVQGANLGVVPVLWEDNLPQISIEMVSMGVPVLSSNAGGASELCDSDLFKFKAGDVNDFIDKLVMFIENPELADEYWKHHNGLTTMKMHVDRIMNYYGIGKAPTITISMDDYNDLLEENEFLYKNIRLDMNDELRNSKDELESKIAEISAQRDELGWRLTETRKSKTYKIGSVITAIPRKIIGK